ncbi:GMC family oxidoreductase [Streptomyces aurantiacus]|uniref:GMC family oxidoreductase n=1 Tax=Streptomyces aurantiacus TaxID=47760 RepID=UPI0027D81D3F|nr:GMC family oxidoreductase N-terminal domain-containing protein [Streptomyces aurantiacus]
MKVRRLPIPSAYGAVVSSGNVVDYIIVGGGAAGSALAHQLGVNPQNRVLVIEAGGSDLAPRHLLPANFVQASGGSQFMKQSASQPFATGRVEQWRTGRVLDGSTTANGTVWNRGGEVDHETWEAAGITGWNWSRFQRAFTAIERHAVGATALRGGGRQAVEVASPRDAASDLWIDALVRQGIDRGEDLNGRHERVAYAPLSVLNGTRTTARAFLGGHARRPNVRVRLHCKARRILFDGTTATGVEAKTARGTVRFTARREVILCAGTIESPLLLERSGVGDPELLTAAGVHLVATNPAVGGNLRQRRGAIVALRLNSVPRRNQEPTTSAARLRSRVRHALRRSGAPAHDGATVLAVLSSDRRVPSPDMELLFTPVSVSDHDGAPAGTDGATAAFYPQSPTSVGSIHITGPALNDPPRLVPGYLSTDHDKNLTVAAFARVREILASEPFASAATETLPGPEVVDAADVLQYVLDHGFTGNHEVGTCTLGPGGVVDDELRVHGTHRLRVADASVLPMLTTGSTAAPSTAVGWIAGDILRNANTQGR